METEQYCFRKYKFECFINKIKLHCYCVVFFVVCQIPVTSYFTVALVSLSCLQLNTQLFPVPFIRQGGEGGGGGGWKGE